MSNGQHKYPLVLVEWEDSQRPLSAWQWVDEYSLPDAVRCFSVGFLIAKTDLALALAPNLGDIEQDREQACGIIRIPASAVITLSPLQLPENSSLPERADLAPAATRRRSGRQSSKHDQQPQARRLASSLEPRGRGKDCNE
jgi:hypothetical protein